MNQFSPSEAALEGFRLTRERPGTILAWAAIYFVAIAIIGAIMLASLGPAFIELAKQGPLTNENLEEASALLGQSWPAFLLVLLLVVTLMSVLTAGIYRIVLRPEEPGLFHLRFGRDEMRLTLVNLLLFAVGMVCLMAGIVVTGMGEMAAGRGAGLLFGAATLGLTIWVGVRLSMATPMTFVRQRIALRESWELTRGRFWRLFGMIVLAVIFYVMIFLLVSIIAAAAVGLAGGQEAMADPARVGPAALIGVFVYGVLQVVLQVLQIVMIYAPFAVAYRQITADGSEVF
jgi:hypothetical protein